MAWTTVAPDDRREIEDVVGDQMSYLPLPLDFAVDHHHTGGERRPARSLGAGGELVKFSIAAEAPGRQEWEAS